VDINRDSHQQTHEATRAVHHMFHEWHPTVVHDLHESIALLLTWNGTGPYNPHVDPITHGEFLELSFHEVRRLTALGMPGVWTWKFGEGFGHHYLDSVAMNHNALGRGYETFGNTTAETLRRELDPGAATMEWYRPAPPPRSFDWSARDNVNYNQTALLAALEHTARNAKDFLRGFYLKGLHSWRKGRDEAPFGFVIPRDQGDRARVAELVRLLLAQRIEVGEATTAFELADGRYPAGSYVVKLDQPYRNYAVDLLTPQRFPKDGGEPYDDVSWSLPAHYRLEVRPTADPAVREVRVAALAERPAAPGSLGGDGPVFALRDTGQESLLAARHRLARFDVRAARAGFRAGGSDYPAGSWLLPAREGLAAALRETAGELGLDFASLPAAPDVPSHSLPLPRLGVFVPWADTDSIGWVRYALDQRKVPYAYVRDEDVRAGGLREHFDVLLYGHVDLELAEQIQGLPRTWGPMPFKKTATTPSHGTPAESDDITGGIGYAGLAELERFVHQGGLLVTLGSGSTLALEGGLVRGVRRSTGGVPRSEDGDGAGSSGASARAATRTPGAHVRATFARPDHPLAYGYPARTHVFRQNFPLYDAPRAWLRMAYCTSCLDGPEDRRGIVLEWGDREGAPLVVSGQAWGEDDLVGRPAILDLAAGRGRVVAFNFNPLHRDLNRGDHRLVWNAILNWQAIVDGEAR
jgi:hypothetical protein